MGLLCAGGVSQALRLWLGIIEIWEPVWRILRDWVNSSVQGEGVGHWNVKVAYATVGKWAVQCCELDWVVGCEGVAGSPIV